MTVCRGVLSSFTVQRGQSDSVSTDIQQTLGLQTRRGRVRGIGEGGEIQATLMMVLCEYIELGITKRQPASHAHLWCMITCVYMHMCVFPNCCHLGVFVAHILCIQLHCYVTVITEIIWGTQFYNYVELLKHQTLFSLQVVCCNLNST